MGLAEVGAWWGWGETLVAALVHWFEDLVAWRDRGAGLWVVSSLSCTVDSLTTWDLGFVFCRQGWVVHLCPEAWMLFF